VHGAAASANLIGGAVAGGRPSPSAWAPAARELGGRVSGVGLCREEGGARGWGIEDGETWDGHMRESD
jgi:hypothetical protein